MIRSIRIIRGNVYEKAVRFFSIGISSAGFYTISISMIFISMIKLDGRSEAVYNRNTEAC